MVGDRWWVLKLSLEGENKSEGDLTSKVIVLSKNLERKSNREAEAAALVEIVGQLLMQLVRRQLLLPVVIV